MSSDALTGKQLRFVQGLAAGKTQRQAAIDAGAVFPDKEGSRWVRLPKVQARLKEMIEMVDAVVTARAIGPSHPAVEKLRDAALARSILWDQAEGLQPAEIVTDGQGTVKLKRFKPQASAMALLTHYSPQGPGLQLQVNVLPADMVTGLYRGMVDRANGNGHNGNGNGHLPSGDPT